MAGNLLGRILFSHSQCSARYCFPFSLISRIYFSSKRVCPSFVKCIYIYCAAIAIIVLIWSCKALKFSKLYRLLTYGSFNLLYSYVFRKSFFTLTSYEVIIHRIPKWRPINYSFVCMLISSLCLIFTLKFFCVSYMLTRQRGLINNAYKRIIYWPPFCNKVYLTIIPRARMGSESIAHEAEGRMGY